MVIILLPLLTFGVGNPTLHMEDLPGGSSILNMRVESVRSVVLISPSWYSSLIPGYRNPARVRAIETELLQLNCVSCDPWPPHSLSQSEAGITPDPWPPLSHSLIATLTSRFLDPNNNPKMVTLPSSWLADNSLARILRNNSTDN